MGSVVSIYIFIIDDTDQKVKYFFPFLNVHLLQTGRTRKIRYGLFFLLSNNTVQIRNGKLWVLNCLMLHLLPKDRTIDVMSCLSSQMYRIQTRSRKIQRFPFLYGSSAAKKGSKNREVKNEFCFMFWLLLRCKRVVQ